MAHGIHKIEAEYTPYPIESYQDNPLIEALPCYLEYSGRAILNMLSGYPEVPHPEAGNRQRSAWLSQLSSNLFIPLLRHYELGTLITTLILQGYEKRKPVNGQYVSMLQRAYHERMQGKNNEVNFGGRISASPMTLSLIGVSGIGKSYALERLMRSMYPQLIHHNAPEMGAVFDQVVYLKTEVPSGGSVKAMCVSLLSELSRVTGNSYADGIRKNTTLECLRVRLESLFDAHCVGLIILDEVQNLLASRSSKTELFNFIVELSNTINVPIIFVGTPKILEIRQQGMRVSRRLGTAGCLQWDRMHYRKRDWNTFIEELWKYNVLPSEVPVIPDEIEQTLYDLSQGIPDLLIKLFILTQQRTLACAASLISQGKPILMYKDTIMAVYDDYFGHVKPMIEILRSNDKERIAEIEDLSLDYGAFDDAMRQETAKINENSDNFQCEEPDPKSLLAGMAEQYLRSMKVDITNEIRSFIKQYLDENEDAGISETVLAALNYIHPQSENPKTENEQNKSESRKKSKDGASAEPKEKKTLTSDSIPNIGSIE